MSENPLHNEKELLERLANADERAFREIYDHYHRAVYYQAYHYLQSAELAEDTVQDVFLKLWSKREGMVEIRSLKSYLFIVARNSIISDLRKKVFHQWLDDVSDIVVDEDLLPDRQINLKQAREVLIDAIASLPQQQQNCFHLSRDEGMGYKEIGQKLGISEHTVKSHMSAALRSIRQALESKAVDLGVLILLFLIKK